MPAATAVYGSRAANGVIVIETSAPEPGEIRISYAGTLAVSAPDLSSYHLLNAVEALEAEYQGRFIYRNERQFHRCRNHQLRQPIQQHPPRHRYGLDFQTFANGSKS